MRTLPAGLLLAALALVSVASCEDGARRPVRAPIDPGMAHAAEGPPGPGVAPGIDAAALIGHRVNQYTGNTGAIEDGRRLFNAYNCSGCHSGYAGGGMGPNLRDSVWIYGATDADLFATITAGRPNGMPAWGGRIPEDQIWRIIAYLRTLGTRAEPEKPPTPTRTTMSSTGKGAA